MLPSIMMLVLCVGVLAVGVYAALSPTENKVAGKITINATNSPVTTKVYKEGEDGNKVFIKQMESRKGDTLDISAEVFEFNTEKANKVNEVEPVVLYVEFSTTVAENLVVDTPTIQYFDGKTQSEETISNLATVTKFHTYTLNDAGTGFACFNKDHGYEIKCTFRLGDFVDEATTIFFDMTFNICKASDYEGDGIDGVDYLKFGEYPQSEAKEGVTFTRDPNGAVFAAYEVQSSEENATGNAIYNGSDGNRYVEVKYAYATVVDEYGDRDVWQTEDTKYFLIEPLKWRILNQELDDGGNYSNTLLMCDVIVEHVQYQNGNYYDDVKEYGTKAEYYVMGEDDKPLNVNGAYIYANNYEYSDLRYYLKNTFFNNAFSALQQQLVKIMDVKNGVETIGTDLSAEDCLYECNDILAEDGGDPVFALSRADLNNINNDEKIISVSGYATATGALSDSNMDGNFGYWWGRSPDDTCSDMAVTVHSDGFVENNYLDFGWPGALPALRISLK